MGPLNFQRFVERVFPNISDATLRLPGKSVKHQFETASDVVENIFKFYSSEALKQFYKIVGALDIVGNPAMLVTSFASGIRDFVMTPSSALINSPTDPSRLGIGVAQVRFLIPLETFWSGKHFSNLSLYHLRVRCRSCRMVQVDFPDLPQKRLLRLVKLLRPFLWTTNFVIGITIMLWFQRQI